MGYGICIDVQRVVRDFVQITAVTAKNRAIDPITRLQSSRSVAKVDLIAGHFTCPFRRAAVDLCHDAALDGDLVARYLSSSSRVSTVDFSRSTTFNERLVLDHIAIGTAFRQTTVNFPIYRAAFERRRIYLWQRKQAGVLPDQQAPYSPSHSPYRR